MGISTDQLTSGGLVEVEAMCQQALPRQHAFVVSFHVEADLAQARCVGRVEHVASGRAAHFYTPEALLACMGQVLSDLALRPAEEE